MIPSFFILDCKVVRFIPSVSAAPPLPVTRQPVFTRTSRIWLRSTSSRLPLVGMVSEAGMRWAQPQGPTAARNHGAFHDVSQFPGVARPRVALRGLHALAGDMVDPFAQLFLILPDERPDQRGDILRSAHVEAESKWEKHSAGNTDLCETFPRPPPEPGPDWWPR